VPDPVNPQAFNRYSYVYNRTIVMNDPTGHDPWWCETKTCTTNWIKQQTQNAAAWAGKVLVQSKDKPKSGTGGDNSGGDPEPGHSYGNVHNEPNPVCLDMFWIDCTDAEVDDYLSRWQYPGQLFWNPIQDGGRYNVFPEKLGNIPTVVGFLFPGSGAIRVEFDDHSITNIALRSHVFYKGYVKRTWYRDENSNPYVMTYGEGTNDGFGIVPGFVIDEANELVGPYVFEALDLGLVTYTTIVETGQYVSSFLP
jgi:hypothetical protein